MGDNLYEDQVFADPVGESAPEALDWKEVGGEDRGKAASRCWGHGQCRGVEYLNWTQKLDVVLYSQ